MIWKEEDINFIKNNHDKIQEFITSWEKGKTTQKTEEKSMINKEENIMRFEDLMRQVDREGIDKLLEYIKTKTDFYEAPASTNFHLACAGGLLQHSLNVYDCLTAKRSSPVWKRILEDVSEETLILSSLLHDLCKANFYEITTKNQKTYEKEKVLKALPYQVKTDAMGQYIWETVPGYKINDSCPLGHGEKSVMIASCFVKLKTQEIFAIRWHMGFSEDRSQYNSLGAAMEKYPLVLAIHEADLEASKLLEDVYENKDLSIE